MTSTKPESIWTRAFALLCFAEFLGYAQYAVLQPTFPLYITHLGGSPGIVGLIIASFGVLSVVLLHHNGTENPRVRGVQEIWAHFCS